MSIELQKLLEQVADKRAAYLEMYAAAFLREVGTHEASKYTLVERIADNEITWSFEQK